MHGVVWFPSQIHGECVEEAWRHYQFETGGALMGYWHGTGAAVVTAAIDAGPGAVRERHNFEPDQNWQLQEIARRYEASGRRETYLGDWHSHPNAKTGLLSFTDRGVIRRIINTPAARAPHPIMIVFHGADREWNATTWVAALRPRRIIWSKLTLSEVELRLY